MCIIAVSSVALSWDRLQSRLNENTFNTLNGRLQIYENTERIVEDYPIFGSGPGTFASVYHLYRKDPSELWYAQAHNDYLQTLATFGRVGFTAVMFLVVLVFGYWFVARGIPTSELFVAFIWMAAAGCLMHARFDFPLQVYSILLLFTTLSAILTTLARRS
jgi:O-antigen ligase